MLALCLAVGLAPAAASAEPSARVEGVDDEELREIIEQAVGETERDIGSRLEARRRARDAGERAVAALRSEGYYGNAVEPDVGEGEEAVPVIRITPGPRFLFADPQLAWVGDPPAEEAGAAARAALGVEPGEPGRAAAVVAAEGRAVAVLQDRGYADAKAGEREVIVDHADSTVRPTFRLAAGTLVRLDGIDLRSEGRTDPEWVYRLAPWKEGQVYAPDDVAELERRLLDTGVYESVTVSLAPQSRPDGLRPVIVSLADRPRRLIEVGASYSTAEGPGVEARWSRFNSRGRGDTLVANLILAQLERRLDGVLSLPHFRRPGRTLNLRGALFQEETDAFDRTGASVGFDLEQRFGKTTYLTYGLMADVAQVAELGIERNLATLTGLIAYALDRSDDPLDPSRGWRVEGRTEPTFSFGDDTLAYLRTVAQYAHYFPLGEEARTVLAGRVRAGAILGGSIPEVPADRRFYAGGGGSVRGFEYQAVGPRNPDNSPAGGLSLLEVSGEVRHDFTERWGGVGFVDAGSVGLEELPTFDEARYAVGAGVRYKLPFGPVRADLAIPLNKREGESPFQIYISIGQAF